MAGPGWNVNLEQGALVGAVAMVVTWVMAHVAFRGGLRAFEARTEERFEGMKAALAQHQKTEERNNADWRDNIGTRLASIEKILMERSPT